ncbi:hypothetical protein BsWGS_22864 [Bradybaena similaris]
MMLSYYLSSTILIFGVVFVAAGAIIPAPDDMQQEFDICDPDPPKVRLNFPGDSVVVYVHVPQSSTNTYAESCTAIFETCDSCRFKISAVQPQFEYPECRQASWSESYCPLDCAYMILLDADYESLRRRVTNSLAAEGFETESKKLQVVACGHHNSPENVTMRLLITSLEKVQHITGSMFESSSRRTFTSPNFPNPYVRNNECYTYRFESSSRDQFITVTFDDWMLSPYSSVKFDGANIVNRIGGDNSRPYIVSNGRTMNMTFCTGERRRMSSDFNFIGFKGQARFFDDFRDIPEIELGCDRQLSTSEGGIMHLNAAADGQNRDCIWIIKKLSAFDGVYVKIIRYKTRYELMKTCDYGLEVREGITSNASLRLNLKLNDAIPNYAVQLSENGFYIRIKGCYFDDSVVLSYAMYLDDCDDYREYYKCDNGRCIADHLRCDTYDHCGDGSDEIRSMCGRSKLRKAFGEFSSGNASNSSAVRYDYSLSIHIIIPLVVSVVLGVGIMCLLILLVRRCRRLNNSIIGNRPRTSQGRRGRGRRFNWRNRGVQMSVTMSSGDFPPSYEEVIRNTPIGQLNMAFSWSAGDNTFTQPPSYDEAVSPISRTAQLAAGTSTHTAITNSNSNSSCHLETSSNLPQFHSRPFLVATLSASLCTAADTSLSSAASELSCDNTHRLDILLSSNSSHVGNSLTSADFVSDRFFTSSNQNKNKGEPNSQNSSDGNTESGNTAMAVCNSRASPKKIEDNLSVHSNISQRNNNKPLCGKSVVISDDQSQGVDDKVHDATRNFKGKMGYEGGKNSSQRREALDRFADNYRVGSVQNLSMNGATSNDCVVPLLDNDDFNVRSRANSSRSQSCADLPLGIGKLKVANANGKSWQDDKRFSYAGAGDVSLMRHGLDPFGNSRNLLNTTPMENLSRLPTADSVSNARSFETNSVGDKAPKKHNLRSNQATEFSKNRMDTLGMPTPSSLDPVLENSYEEYDLKIASLGDAARTDFEPSRDTDNKVNNGLSRAISRNKMYPVVSEKHRFETSCLGSKQMKPDAPPKISEHKSKHSKEDNRAKEDVSLSQNVVSSHQNNAEHKPGDRHVLPDDAKKHIFQNPYKNMNSQSSSHCTVSAVQDDAGQVPSHLRSQCRISGDSVAELGHPSAVGHEGFVQAANIKTTAVDLRSSERPKPAPRSHSKSQVV